MVRRPSRFSIAVTGVLLVLFLGWTGLVAGGGPLQRLDQRVLAAPHSEDTAAGQVFSAFALLTWPGVIYLGVAGIAIWALQRRLRNLAAGLALTIVFSWGGTLAIKLWVRRDRPSIAADVITSQGYSYPSSHLSAITAGVLAVAVTLVVIRQTRVASIAWRVGGLILILVTALDRWWLNAHYLSDLVGGLLWGAFSAALAITVTGVTVLPRAVVLRYRRKKPIELEEGTEGPTVAPKRRCAVVYNPTKVLDLVTFRRHVEYELSSRGWAPAIWLETTVDDAGRAMTARAVEEQVDLVLGAGGDGTIRLVAAGLAGTGIPFGLIAAGTGNLLARNLGIPLDESAALDVAFDGVDKPIDVVRLTIDGTVVDDFMVMAGIGIDAVIMQGTDPNLKKAVGSAAYFVAAAQNANHPALHATIQVDDEPPFRRKAHVLVIGNVGFLQANIPLIPDAKADDGLLDVMIASPAGVRDWVRLGVRVMTRQKRGDAQLDRLVGRKVRITVEERDHYQLDGDTVGECSEMVAEIRPGALTIRMPG